jgi:hypothetical protein
VKPEGAHGFHYNLDALVAGLEVAKADLRKRCRDSDVVGGAGSARLILPVDGTHIEGPRVSLDPYIKATSQLSFFRMPSSRQWQLNPRLFMFSPRRTFVKRAESLHQGVFSKIYLLLKKIVWLLKPRCHCKRYRICTRMERWLTNRTTSTWSCKGMGNPWTGQATATV